jgi:glycogen(starch) synthase
MKVLLTTDTVGGVWTYAVELARGLRPLGVEVVLATMGDLPTAAQRSQVARQPNVDLRESGLKLEWMDAPWDDVRRAGDWLMSLEQDVRPDVVHLNGYAHGQWPFAAPTLVVGHSCVLSWWEAVKREPAPSLAWARYRSEVWAGLRRADLVVAPSAAMLAALVRHYGPLPATRVIPNGRDPAAFRTAAAKEAFVLTAGRLWDEAKNVAALERVAPALPWPVRVAGEDRHPAGGGRATTAGLELLGRLDEVVMADAFARASVYCLPARYEPFGLSALEAALSGCALVLGDIPSLREVWGDAAAVYVPPDDVNALREALLGLIRHPAERRERARLARARAQQYTSARMAEEYLCAYRNLLGATGASTTTGAATTTGAKVALELEASRPSVDPARLAVGPQVHPTRARHGRETDEPGSAASGASRGVRGSGVPHSTVDLRSDR